ATLAIAIVHICFIVAAGLLARRLARLADHVEHELKPIFTQLNAIGRDASRAAALAAAQVERADRLFGEVAQKIEQTLATVQATIAAPAHEARAILSALRAAIEALRDLRARGRGRHSRSE